MSDAATKVWYGSSRWKAIRAQQLQLEPLCAMCAKRGRVVAARVADHIEPHRGDAERFWTGSLQSLCTPCHSRDKQLHELGRKAVHIGIDGFPLDE